MLWIRIEVVLTSAFRCNELYPEWLGISSTIMRNFCVHESYNPINFQGNFIWKVTTNCEKIERYNLSVKWDRFENKTSVEPSRNGGLTLWRILQILLLHCLPFFWNSTYSTPSSQLWEEETNAMTLYESSRWWIERCMQEHLLYNTKKLGWNTQIRLLSPIYVYCTPW